jgi:hypothetical protein
LMMAALALPNPKNTAAVAAIIPETRMEHSS